MEEKSEGMIVICPNCLGKTRYEVVSGSTSNAIDEDCIEVTRKRPRRVCTQQVEVFSVDSDSQEEDIVDISSPPQLLRKGNK